MKLAAALRLVVAVAVAGTALAPRSASAVNLVANGSFEQGDHVFESTDFPGWSWLGGQTFNVAEGSLQGYWEMPAEDGHAYAVFSDSSGISQSLATVAGTAYDVSFYLGNGGDGASSLTVAFDGQTLFQASAWGRTPWTLETFQVVATGASTLLSFTNPRAGNPGYLSLDDVRVVAHASEGPLPAPLPEPATLALAAVASLSMIAGRRRGAR